jgi:hypothetical protein
MGGLQNPSVILFPGHLCTRDADHNSPLPPAVFLLAAGTTPHNRRGHAGPAEHHEAHPWPDWGWW